MSWVLRAPPGADGLLDYERSLDADEVGTRLLLCQYDHERFASGDVSDLAAAHGVDVSPLPATIGRVGVLAAARVRATGALRLAGQLDFGGADAVAGVLETDVHEPVRLDRSDLDYVDVAGMRAMRGPSGRPLEIMSASEPVRRLLALLAWDTDPDVAIVEAA